MVGTGYFASEAKYNLDLSSIPKGYRQIKVGDDLSGKEVLFIFPQRFRTILWGSFNNMNDEDFAYQIALDSNTTFGPSHANNIFLQPASLVSYSYSSTNSAALFKSGTHTVYAMVATAAKIPDTSGDTTTRQAGYVMDNYRTILGSRYTLPDDFGVITDINTQK